MSAQILDGKAVAKRLQNEVAEGVTKIKSQHGITPGLAAVLVGNDPASAMYVRMKRNRCAEVGIESFAHEIPSDITQSQLENLIHELNQDTDVHGILVQLPLPGHIDEERILAAVDLEKDVDGFHPVNIGRLAMKDREPLFIPATPYGSMVLLREAEKLIEGFTVSGSNAVVLGRSNIVGMPMALLLIQANATVTVCHSRTKDIPAMLADADIVVSAMGHPHMIKGDWIPAGAVVIDIATVKVEDPSAEKGYRWVGDIEPSAMQQAGAMTPVPGGVGPMTIAMLLKNTLHAAEIAIKKQQIA